MRSAGLTRRLALLLGLSVLALAPVARGQGTPAMVSIQHHRFEPASLSIKAGTTVRWVNDEKRTSHSVLFKGEDGLESERLFPGESWERRFDRPGRYAYTCGPHPEMLGVIEVLP